MYIHLLNIVYLHTITHVLIFTNSSVQNFHFFFVNKTLLVCFLLQNYVHVQVQTYCTQMSLN